MSKKNPELQPDLAYIDSDGKLRDDGLHDEMLSSKAGNAASQKAAYDAGDKERHEQGDRREVLRALMRNNPPQKGGILSQPPKNHRLRCRSKMSLRAERAKGFHQNVA